MEVWSWASQRGIEVRRPVAFRGEFRGCFGCGEDNPKGLGLRFWETEDAVEAEVVAAEHFQGAQGILHGGIQATILDETMCMVAYAKLQKSVVTGELKIRYRRPVPVGVPLRVVASIRDTDARSAFIEASLCVGDETEARTVASGRFFFEKS